MVANREAGNILTDLLDDPRTFVSEHNGVGRNTHVARHGIGMAHSGCNDLDQIGEPKG